MGARRWHGRVRRRCSRRCPTPSRRTAPGPGATTSSSAMASFSLSESLLAHYGARLPAMEHRYLNALAAAQPDRRRLRVRLLGGLRARGARRTTATSSRPTSPTGCGERLHVVVVDDPAPRPLAEKLLDRPDLSTEVRRLGRRAARPSSSRGTSPSTRWPWPSSSASRSTAPRRSCGPRRSRAPGAGCSTATGVPVPLGREDVHTVDDVVAAAEWIRVGAPRRGGGRRQARRQRRGRRQLRGRAARRRPGTARDPHEVLRAASPRCRTGSSTTSPPVAGSSRRWWSGDELRSPSVQVDLLPGGGVRVLATHDQVLGGDNGQVYLGCRFPADPAYAADLARHGDAVAHELASARLRRAGRASTSWPPARGRARGRSPRSRSTCARAVPRTRSRRCATWSPGRYDAEAGAWVADATAAPGPTAPATTSSTRRWPGAAPHRSSTPCATRGCSSTARPGSGVVLHMLGCLAVDGRFGVDRDRPHPGPRRRALRRHARRRGATRRPRRWRLTR